LIFYSPFFLGFFDWFKIDFCCQFSWKFVRTFLPPLGTFILSDETETTLTNSAILDCFQQSFCFSKLQHGVLKKNSNLRSYQKYFSAKIQKRSWQYWDFLRLIKNFKYILGSLIIVFVINEDVLPISLPFNQNKIEEIRMKIYSSTNHFLRERIIQKNFLSIREAAYPKRCEIIQVSGNSESTLLPTTKWAKTLK